MIVISFTFSVLLFINFSDTIPDINVPMTGLKIFMYGNILEAGLGYIVARITPISVDKAPG